MVEIEENIWFWLLFLIIGMGLLFIWNYFWKKRRVAITGHTGFKGSWLTLWLTLHKAKVLGISKNIPTKPSHYQSINLSSKIKNVRLDLRNLDKLKYQITRPGRPY